MLPDPLSDEEAAAYGRYVGAPTRAELEKMIFLDDADRKLIGRRRGDQHRLGFALQLTTARFVGRFLRDPLEVPAEVIDYLAGQLSVADVSQIKQYTERRQTQFDHQDEIKKAYGLREFSAVENAALDLEPVWHRIGSSLGGGRHFLGQERKNPVSTGPRTLALTMCSRTSRVRRSAWGRHAAIASAAWPKKPPGRPAICGSTPAPVVTSTG